MNHLTQALVAAAVVASLAACSDDEPAAGGIGAPLADAGCAPIKSETWERPPGQASHHVPDDVDPASVDPAWETAPPAAAMHHNAFPMDSQLKNIYRAADRPPVPDIVHLAEHGYNILWYDETLAKDDDLDAIADEYPTGEHLVIAPWTSDDGAAFPGGAHVAFTHWTGPDPMTGVRQYCSKLSGEAVDEFAAAYPKSNSPEPDAP